MGKGMGKGKGKEKGEEEREEKGEERKRERTRERERKGVFEKCLAVGDLTLGETSVVSSIHVVSLFIQKSSDGRKAVQRSLMQHGQQIIRLSICKSATDRGDEKFGVSTFFSRAVTSEDK